MNPIVAANVKTGENPSFGPFCIIGDDEKYPTIFGNSPKIRSHSIIYPDNQIGDNFQTGHSVMIRESNKIGSNVSIGSGSNIEHHTIIEDNARIHSGCFIPEFSHLKKGCWIGPRVCLTNARYPSSPTTKDNLTGVTVGENSKIGANSTILPGIIIGRNCLIGAGSVVTKDLPDDSVAVGNPARVIKKTSDLKHNNGYPVYPNDSTS